MSFPLKQGLRHLIAGVLKLIIRTLNELSIKTRIATEEIDVMSLRVWSLNELSIKTRIDRPPVGERSSFI